MKIQTPFVSLFLMVTQAVVGVVAAPIATADVEDTSLETSGNLPLPRSFGLLVFPAFQAFDVFGPMDALNVLSGSHKLDLAIISSSLDPVSTSPGFDPIRNPFNSTMAQSIVPTHTYETAPSDLEVLFVPGGVGIINPSKEVLNPLLAFIKKTYPKLRYLITVCNGSGLVARTGVLNHKRVTSNKLLWNDIIQLAPKVKWVGKARWVEHGKVWSSSGVSAGVDATLAWIEKVYGKDKADLVTRVLEYNRETDSTADPWWDHYHSGSR